MYAVGSDRIALLPEGIGPGAPAHAVDHDGEKLCRDERPRYHFPARDWMNELTPDQTRVVPCPECATIALERALPAAPLDDPYPSAPEWGAAPAIDWLRFPQDFSVWSDGLS